MPLDFKSTVLQLMLPKETVSEDLVLLYVIILQHLHLHIHPEPLARLTRHTNSHLFTVFALAGGTKRSHSIISACLGRKEVLFDRLIDHLMERAKGLGFATSHAYSSELFLPRNRWL